jgi:hypothetical protein
VIVFDPSDQFREIEFRDGMRLVPTYLAAIMEGLATHKMTYEDSVLAANKQMESNHLNAQRDKILAAHFRELR